MNSKGTLRQMVPCILRRQEGFGKIGNEPAEETLGKGQCFVHKGLEEVGGNEFHINVVFGNIQIIFFVGNAMAAKFTSEREGLAGQGRNLKLDIIQSICTEFSDALSEATVTSS